MSKAAITKYCQKNAEFQKKYLTAFSKHYTKQKTKKSQNLKLETAHENRA